MQKPIYFFGNGKSDGDKTLKPLLGGKGANLAEMANLGLPIPAGFTITTEVCTDYYENGAKLTESLKSEIKKAIKTLEEMTGKEFGGGVGKNPLLVSVRSGAAISMPGMMDTVLNLGLNEQTVAALAAKSGNERFAYDSYRRFLQMYGNVVLGVGHHDFEHELEIEKEVLGKKEDTDLTGEDWKKVIAQYKAMLRNKKLSVPEDPMEQLNLAVDAVFASWDNPRAVTYRRLNDMPDKMGTAVNVQAMVYGNLGETSGTGVAFTRNPATGENIFFGEFLLNAQGEDVVAGIRTPKPINNDTESLQAVMPAVYAELDTIQQQLEGHYKDMQDIEFTIEEGKLYLLQTRTGKRTAGAMTRIAVEMVEEGKITQEQALLRIDPEKIDELLHEALAPNQDLEVLATGLPASPGVAVGTVCFTPEKARIKADKGEKVILVRTETSPEDIDGMDAAIGILTIRGGMTSHAAVVARGMGKCCVCGTSGIEISEETQTMTLGGKTLKEGDFITLNGSTGEVINGKAKTTPPSPDRFFNTILAWADKNRSLQIRTNADTPEGADQARKFGAEGIGLCRTEHMFFEGDRIRHVRAMIMTDDEQQQIKSLAKLEKFQQEDFEKIFEAMDGLPVNVRLLDPPLHEFLPEGEKAIRLLAEDLGIGLDLAKAKVATLHESNPMLGFRGCRLGIINPEITKMQARALYKAAKAVTSRGKEVKLEVMVPLVAHDTELLAQKEVIAGIQEEILGESGVKYPIGTMIELPRACVTADDIAEHADFFSFGTNDLTQTTLGLSRDDAGKFLPAYKQKGIIEADPFVSLDTDGVGWLVSLAVQMGRAIKEDLKCGVCGEHGGDPRSIQFFHEIGLDYVSCSPFRVPVARIAAAQAAINEDLA